MSTKLPCPRCKKKIAHDASVCPYCQSVFTPEEIADRKKQMRFATYGCLGILAVVGLIIAIGSFGTPDPSNSDPTQIANMTNESSETIANESTDPTPAAASPPVVESGLTFAQQQAARSANQYLQMSGFSRRGLIQQLSSDAGDGYDSADATKAVDSLNVDWNAQAARSAEKYLEMTGFSCKGLIEQLSSSAGEDFTTDQATFGATQAGACE